MTIKAELVITPSEMRVIFGAEQGEIRISAQMKKGGVALYYLARRVVAIDKAPETFDAVATIFPPLHEEGELAKELAAVLAGENSPAKLSEFTEQAVTVLARIGYPLEKAADKITDTASKKPAKAQHRWNKAVSTIEFSCDTRQSKATIVWQKRNEMLLKKGATLMPTLPLNKDGSVGFAAKLGEKLRADYADGVGNFTTTKDLIFKSVNEVGIFLYFGGTNGWLEFVDAEGKTIDSYTLA